jgi:F420-dependent oxidoreductase-like protein
MNFGYHYSKFHGSGDAGLFDAIEERAQTFEENGFKFLSFTDHVWQAPVVGQKDDPVLDAYSALAATAAVTDEIKLCPMVTPVGFRNPAMVGRMLTSIDVISSGRTVFGIGAGWYEEEFEACGWEFPDASKRISQVEDTIRLLKTLWTQESPVTYAGEHYQLKDVYLEPKPAQDPHPPVLVGGGGEQLTLRVAAKYADRWNTPWLTHDEYRHKLDVLRDHCESVGRPYDEIHKSAVDMVVIRDSEPEAQAAYESLMSSADWDHPSREEYRGAIGTPDDVIEHVQRFRDEGIDLYIFEAPRNDVETIDRFVEEVVPRV